MKPIAVFKLSALAAGVALAVPGWAADYDVPDPLTLNPFTYSGVGYGDFYSYDLFLEQYLYDEGFNLVYPTIENKNPYSVGMSGGSIHDAMNVYTGEGSGDGSGPVSNTQPPPCDNNTCDNPYDPDQGTSSTNDWYTFEDAPDPQPNTLPPDSGTDIGDPNFDDDPDTWDVDLATLADYLTIDGVIHDPLFYYGHNQTGVNPDLFVIGQVFFEDLDGVQETLYYDFLDPTSGFGSGAVPGGGCADTSDPTCSHAVYENTFDRLASGEPDSPFGTSAMLNNFVLSPGENCFVVDEVSGAPLYQVICPDGLSNAELQEAPEGSIPGYDPTVNELLYLDHNAGRVDADYAVWAPEIDIAAFLGMGYDVMRVDFRLGCRIDDTGDFCQGTYVFDENTGGFVEARFINGFLDNGYETLSIGLKVREQVPVPGTLFLLGGGILAAGFVRRRQRPGVRS